MTTEYIDGKMLIYNTCELINSNSFDISTRECESLKELKQDNFFMTMHEGIIYVSFLSL